VFDRLKDLNQMIEDLYFPVRNCDGKGFKVSEKSFITAR